MIGKDIDTACTFLKQGEVVAVPTETVYGLAADALNEVAVSKIFAVKQRPFFDPLIIHVHSLNSLLKYVEEIPAPLLKLAENFMPGPLTLLLKKKPVISDLVTSGSDFVAIRIPDHPLILKLLKLLDLPLAAPSANPFGYISPTTAQHVFDQLGDKIPYILDGGPCSVGIESTIVGMRDEKITVFRKGGLSTAAIEKITGLKTDILENSSSNPAAPGMLTSHYAPKVPLILGNIEKLLPNYNPNKTGVICFSERVIPIPEVNKVILSKNGDFAEAARNLFAGMRRLDGMDIDIIIAELVPETDLGQAINDRLRRAASNK